MDVTDEVRAGIRREKRKYKSTILSNSSPPLFIAPFVVFRRPFLVTDSHALAQRYSEDLLTFFQDPLFTVQVLPQLHCLRLFGSKESDLLITVSGPSLWREDVGERGDQMALDHLFGDYIDEVLLLGL